MTQSLQRMEPRASGDDNNAHSGYVGLPVRRRSSLVTRHLYQPGAAQNTLDQAMKREFYYVFEQ
jgi:hypothetical protein